MVKPSMNIREIAKRAKVSTATVSRTINRISTVDPRLAKRVWKVIEESGYRPNIQARALVSGRSQILGLVVSDITNPFFPEIVQAFENIAVEHGYDILLVSTVHDPKQRVAHFPIPAHDRTARGWRDNAVLTSTTTNETLLLLWKTTRIEECAGLSYIKTL